MYYQFEALGMGVEHTGNTGKVLMQHLQAFFIFVTLYVF